MEQNSSIIQFPLSPNNTQPNYTGRENRYSEIQQEGIPPLTRTNSDCFAIRRKSENYDFAIEGMNENEIRTETSPNCQINSSFTKQRGYFTENGDKNEMLKDSLGESGKFSRLEISMKEDDEEFDC
jgi:hypothetical protein